MQQSKNPSFRESNRSRSLFQRLTPVTWLVLILAVMLGIGIATALLERSRIDQPSAGSISQAGAATSAMRPGEVIPIANGAFLVTRQDDGTLRADSALEAKIVNDVRSALSWSAAQTAQSYLADYETHASSAYLGQLLDAERSSVTNFDTLGLQTAGGFEISISNFDPSGEFALVRIARRGIRMDVYDKKSLAKVRENVVVEDFEEVVRVYFDKATNRWKPSQTVGRRTY